MEYMESQMQREIKRSIQDMNDLPPVWAVEKALKLMAYGGIPLPKIQAEPNEHYEVVAFARYITEHEEAPVDPDVLAVREIIAAWVNQDSSYQIEAMNGKLDCREDFARCLSAYRKHRNPGASS